MSHVARYLYLAGAVPFLVLGPLHVLATPLAPGDRKGLSPADPALAEAMRASRPLITRRTDLWACWVGFNLSHGLGVIALAAFVLATGITPAGFAAVSRVCVPLAVLASVAYLAISARYWFRTPTVGCALALACFVAAWVLG
jgi:hypothetical protein